MTDRHLLNRLARYCAWYRLVRGCTVLQAVLFGVCAAAGMCILCDKAFYLGIDYTLVLSITAALGLLVLLVYYILVPRNASHVSYLVDRNAGLKNLVSSGLNVVTEPDELSAAVVDRATTALQHCNPAKLLPFNLHWTGRYLYIPALILVASLLIPHLDLAGRRKRIAEAAVEQAEVQKGALKLAAKLTSIQDQTRHLESIEGRKITKEFGNLADDLMGVAKKDALLKLGEFESKYRDEFSEQRNFEQAAKGLQSRPNMKGLSLDSQKQLKKLMKKLSDGNFKDAGDAMRELANQLKGKDLSADQKKALAREMRKVAEQMQGGACGEKLAKLLRQIESSPEDIADLLSQCQEAGKELEDMASFCDECDGLKAMREGLADAKREMLGDSFSDFDPREVEQYLAGEACLGRGCGMGDGTGGEGKGRGGAPLENMTETGFKSRLSPSKINKGKILHQLFVTGIPEKGDALVEYTDVIKAAKRHAAGSLARDKIPREYESMVKSYFDSLELQKSAPDNEGEGGGR